MDRGARATAFRLEIVRQLSSSGELSAGDLAAALGSPPSKLSSHLAAMVAAGSLETTPRGRQRFFRVATPSSAPAPPLARIRVYFVNEWKPGVPERAPDLVAESATELLTLVPTPSGLTAAQVAIVRAAAVGLASFRKGGDAVIDVPAGIYRTLARAD